MKLYHVSNIEIPNPDIHYGRKNADFGWGFYLTPDSDFARRWAGEEAVLNQYELDENGLTIQTFSKDEDWVRYILRNRKLEDMLNVDVVMGPVANDILFDTLGVISSGVLPMDTVLRLLLIGPNYTQLAIKTEKAKRQLRWIGAEKLSGMDKAAFHEEEEAFLQEFAEILDQS